MAGVSFVLNVGSRLVLVLVLRVWCWFACGVGRSAYAAVSFVHVFGSRLVMVVVLRVGFGRSACAVVSSHLFLGSAPRVGRPMPESGNFPS